jgi:hypothetical protein
VKKKMTPAQWAWLGLGLFIVFFTIDSNSKRKSPLPNGSLLSTKPSKSDDNNIIETNRA